MERKHRHQRIRRYWEKEHKKGRYVTEYWKTQFEAKAAKKAPKSKKQTPQKSKVETAKRKEREGPSSKAAQVEESATQKVRIAVVKKRV